MSKRNFLPVLLFLTFILAAGCSSSVATPELIDDLTPPSEGHSIWGQFNITIDPDDQTVLIDPVRDNDAHYDVTSIFTWPDNFQVHYLGYDGTDQIYYLRMYLRNPSGYTGFDVKTILSNYDTKEFLQPDGWTKLHSMTGQYEPYYVLAKDNPDNAFGPGEIHSRDFAVHVPAGASFNVTVTISASWPLSQQEVWGIDNVIVSGPLQNDMYHFIAFTVHVRDHQDNIEFVYADLSPLGAPSHVNMGDDAGHYDYLSNDGIYGLGEIITGVAPGDYDIWVYAKSIGSPILTAQKIGIEVIEPVSETIPLYVVSMMHAEENSMFLEEAIYQTFADNLRDLKQVFNDHGAKIAIQPDWTFIQGTVNFDSTLFSEFQADGHGVDTHAHESIYNLAEVHDMLDDAGVTGTIMANGGFNTEWGDPDDTWAKYISHFTDDSGQQMFLAVNAYKWAATQENDSLFTPIRPSLTGDWMVHDPSSPVVYLPGPVRKLDRVNFFSDMQVAIETAIRGAVPGKINTFYWHDSVHNYDNDPSVPLRIADWETQLTNFFDPKVASGDIIWANFSEMYEIYLEWEGYQ